MLLMTVEVARSKGGGMDASLPTTTGGAAAGHAAGATHPADLEAEIQATARHLFSLIKRPSTSRLSPEHWQSEMMEWAMADERLKVQLFRFVDVFPTLTSRAEIAAHLHEYFADGGLHAPRALRWGIGLTAPGSPLSPAAAAVIRGQLRGFAQRFIVGRDARSAIPALEALRARDTGFTLDVLGEASVSEREADAYAAAYLELLDGLHEAAAAWRPRPIVDQASWGPLPRVNLSIKVTSLYSQLDPIDPHGSIAAVKERLRPIMRKAMQTGAALTLDLEQFRYRDLTHAVFTSLMDEPELAGYADAGVVLQAYLRDADDDLRRLLAWAQAGDRVVNVRLVKGAYWDYETVLAAQEGWPVPVFTHKEDADAMYEKLVRAMLEHPAHIRPAFASHNVRSLACAIATATALGVARDGYEIQALHGMGDPVKEAVRALGLRLREYAPVGELIPGMAYLVRRLLENTANDSFLRQTFVEQSAVNELVRAPRPSPELGAPVQRLPRVTSTDPRAPRRFANQPHADFARAENRDAYDSALAAMRGRLGRRYPLRIGGRPVETARTTDSVDPSRPAEVVGVVAAAGPAEAEAAVAAARAAFPAWRDTPPAERAALLFRAAELMRGELAKLAALEITRGRQAAPRGRRRRRRGDRLLGVLRARDAAPGHAQAYGRRARRAQLLLLSAARRRPRRGAVELPAGDPHRHEQRRAGRRQHRHPQAGRPHAGDRRPARTHPARRPACRRAPSTTCPARAPRSATCSSTIPTWT